MSKVVRDFLRMILFTVFVIICIFFITGFPAFDMAGLIEGIFVVGVTIGIYIWVFIPRKKNIEQAVSQSMPTPKQKSHGIIYGLLGAILSLVGLFFLQFLFIEGGGGIVALILLPILAILVFVPIVVAYKSDSKSGHLTLAWELVIIGTILTLVGRPVVFSGNKNLTLLVNIFMGFNGVISLFYLLPISTIARVFLRNSDKFFWNKIILLSLASLASIFAAYSISSFVVSCCV